MVLIPKLYLMASRERPGIEISSIFNKKRFKDIDVSFLIQISGFFMSISLFLQFFVTSSLYVSRVFLFLLYFL